MSTTIKYEDLDTSADAGDISNAKARARGILHITAGIPGEWEPTEEELDIVAKMFREALTEAEPGDIPVVATRAGITATYIPVDDTHNDLPDYFDESGLVLNE